ncbi:MAG: HAMP domain-containing protein [Telmatospirillum sp.]|nr:HAMP domain-containing protein [Telmatospirillum sp.]
MRIRDLTLRAKVYGAFAIVLSLDILSGGAAIVALGRVNDQTAAIRDVWLPSIGILGDMMSAVENYRVIEGRSLLTQDETERLSSEELLWNARDQVYVLRNVYERSRIHGPSEDSVIAAFDEAWKSYQARSRNMLWHVFRGGGMEEARTIYNAEGERDFRAARDRLRETMALASDRGARAAGSSKRIYDATAVTILVVSAGTLVLSCLLGVFIVRGVTKPVTDLTAVMRRMAEDDLTVAAEAAPAGHRRDEIGVMSMALHELRERLLERHRLIEDEKESLRRLQTAERELLEAERLAALGRMVAGVSHEINTPLGSAYTVATTLVEAHREFSRKVGDNQLRKSDLDAFVDRVGRASGLMAMTLERASDLIRTFKQVAVDQTSSSRRRLDLAEIIHQVVQTTMPQFKHQAIHLEVRAPSGIEMDSFPGPLGQVIGNLLGNAIIHGLEGGREGTVVIEAAREGDRAVMVVADNGKGILPEHMPHLFEPFFTTRFGKGGSGLGLNIVHGIVVHVLGGTIDVASRPGDGARFTVTVPLIAPAQPAPASTVFPASGTATAPDRPQVSPQASPPVPLSGPPAV